MKLSAPVFYLKSKAKQLARRDDIPLHAALDRIARGEGFASWSLLTSSLSAETQAKAVYDRLRPGDLLLIAARPGQGKTLFSLELALEALKAGATAYFYSLEYTARDVEGRFRALGADVAETGGRFVFDGSDDISADYVSAQLKDVAQGSFVVIDYLQLLDQQREKPGIETQVRALNAFAKARGVVIGFISQVSRGHDESAKRFPDLKDVRLPNPLDLSLFDKSCFLRHGRVNFQSTI